MVTVAKCLKNELKRLNRLNDKLEKEMGIVNLEINKSIIENALAMSEIAKSIKI